MSRLLSLCLGLILVSTPIPSKNVSAEEPEGAEGLAPQGWLTP